MSSPYFETFVISTFTLFRVRSAVQREQRYRRFATMFENDANTVGIRDIDVKRVVDRVRQFFAACSVRADARLE